MTHSDFKQQLYMYIYFIGEWFSRIYLWVYHMINTDVFKCTVPYSIAISIEKNEIKTQVY